MNGLFVAATKQHIGKTTVSLSIVNGLKQMFDRVGFIKPVGQQHVTVDDTVVDKDVALFKKYFSLSCQYSDMSPIIVDRPYTRKFIDNDCNDLLESQIEKIKKSYQNISNESDFIVVEGTGHSAVGSVIGLSNARVASILNIPMLLVVNASIGKAIDQFELNKALCDKENVDIVGVVVNKAIPEKVEEVSYYIQKHLDQYGIPLFGTVPFVEGLDYPVISDIEKLFDTQILSKRPKEIYHLKEIALVEKTLTHYLCDLNNIDYENTLFVTHASRNDIVLGFCSHAAIFRATHGREWNSTLLLCNDKYKSKEIDDNISKCNAPILSVPWNTTEVIMKIMKNTAKLNAEDPIRTNRAIEHYSQHIDFKGIVDKTM